MKYRKPLPFTLIEILVVIGIITILAGLLMPALHKAKFRAKYIRWFAYNNGLNRDPNLIINFNFHERDFAVDGNEVVHNGGEGCTIDGYKPEKYHGEIQDYPVWYNSGGRWMMHNKAMSFDGANDYIEVEGTKVFETNGGNSDFTALCWVNFDELSGIQTIMSKSIWPNFSQFIIYAQDDTIKVEAGNATLEYSGSEFKANKWVQVAVTGQSGSTTLYVNGKQQDASGGSGSNKIVIWHVPKGNPAQARVLVIAASGWNGHKHNAPDSYIISNNPDEYYNSLYTDQLAGSKFILGAAGYLDGSKNDFFKGKIDEAVYVKRTMKKSEIEAHYEMGNPY